MSVRLFGGRRLDDIPNLFGVERLPPIHNRLVMTRWSSRPAARLGVLRSALRRIDPTGLVGHVTGEIDLEGHVLVIERIHVAHNGPSLSEDQREAVHRVLAVHAEGCPVPRSLQGAL
jgi:hypothetical protein